MDKIGIRQATKKGYIECSVPGIADFAYPTSELRRGRVQGGGRDIAHYHNNKQCLQNHKMEKQKIVDMDTGKKNALRTGQDRTGQDRIGQAYYFWGIFTVMFLISMDRYSAERA